MKKKKFFLRSPRMYEPITNFSLYNRITLKLPFLSPSCWLIETRSTRKGNSCENLGPVAGNYQVVTADTHSLKTTGRNDGHFLHDFV